MTSQEETRFIDDLLSAAKERKDFRQFTCYSLECVVKVLNDDERWRTFIENANGFDAACIFVDIMLAYPENEEIFIRATSALSRLVVDADIAAALMEKRKGIVEVVFASIESGMSSFASDSVLNALSLIEILLSSKALANICQARAIDFENVVAWLIRLCKSQDDGLDLTVGIGCVRILDRISNYPAVKTILSNLPNVEALLSILGTLVDAMCTNETSLHQMIFLVIRLLSSLSMESSKVTQAIRDGGGLDILLRASNGSDDVLSRFGSRLLCKLVDGDGQTMVQSLKQADDVERTIDVMLGYAKAIGTERFSAELSEDDVSELLSVMVAEASPQVFGAISELFYLVSSCKCGAEKFVRGGIVRIVGSLRSVNISEQSLKNIIEALSNLIFQGVLSNHAGRDEVLSALVTFDSEPWNSSPAVATSVLRLFFALGMTSQISDSTEITARIAYALRIMSKHRRNVNVQINGTNFLNELLLLNMAVEANHVPAIASLGITNAQRSCPKELILPSLELISNMLPIADDLDLGLIRQTASVLVVENILDDELVSASMDVLMTLDTHASQEDNTLTDLLDLLHQRKNSAVYINIPPLVAACVMVLITHNHEGVERLDYIKVLVEILGEYDEQATCKDDDARTLLSSFSLLLDVLIDTKEHEAVREVVAVAASLLVTKTQQVSVVELSLCLLGKAAACSSGFGVASCNVLGGIASALKAHKSHETIICQAIGLLQLLAERGIDPQGAILQAVDFLRSNKNCTQSCLAACLHFVKVFGGQNNANADSLLECGAVEACLEAIAAGGRAYPDDFISLARDALNILIISDDIVKETNVLRNFAVDTKSLTRNTGRVTTVIQRLGLLFLLGQNATKDAFGLADDILTLVDRMVRAFLPVKCSKDRSDFVAACIEMGCRMLYQGTKRHSASLGEFLDRLVSVLLDHQEVTPNLSAITAMLCTIQSGGGVGATNQERASRLFLSIVTQRNETVPDLMRLALSGLTSLMTPEISSILQEADCIHHVCEGVFRSLERNTMDADTSDSFAFLFKMGQQDFSAILIDEVLDAVFACFSHAAKRGIFSCSSVINAMKIADLMASREDGLEILVQHPLVLCVVHLFGRYTTNFISQHELIAVFASVIERTSVSQSIRSNIISQGIVANLMRALRMWSHDFSISTALAKSIHNLSEDGNGGREMEQILDHLDESMTTCSAKGLESALMDIGLLLIAKLQQLTESNANRLIDSTKNILRHTKHTERHGRIWSLICIILLRLMDDVPAVAKRVAAASSIVEECFSAASNLVTGYHASTFAFLCKICQYREGSLQVMQSTRAIRSIFKRSVFSDQCLIARADGFAGGVIDMRERVVKTILKEVSSQPYDIASSDVGAIRNFLFNVDMPRARQVIDAMLEKDISFINTLLEVLSSTTDVSIPEEVKRVLVDAIIEAISVSTEDKIDGLHSHVAVIANLCKYDTRAIILFASLHPETEQGAHAICASDCALEALCQALLLNNVEYAATAASVLSDCLVDNDPFVIGRMTELGVGAAVVQALADSRKLVNTDFSQHTLHILGSLFSAIGSLAILLERSCKETTFCPDSIEGLYELIALFERVSMAHAGNEYICNAVVDVMSVVKKKASGYKNLLSSLQKLSQVAEERPPKQDVIVGELNAMLNILRNMEGELFGLNADLPFPLVTTLGSCSSEKDVLLVTLEILTRLLKWINGPLNKSANYLASTLNVLKDHDDNPDLVQLGISVVAELFEKEPFDQEGLLIHDAISLTNAAVQRHLSSKEIATNGLKVLVNIISRHEKLSKVYVQLGVPATLNSARSAFGECPQVIHHVLKAYHFLAEDMEWTQQIHDMPEMLLRVADKKDLILLLLRTLGALSLNETIAFELVKNKVTRCLIKTMERFKTDRAVMIVSLKVLSNFGATGKKENEATVLAIAEDEGGPNFLSVFIQNLLEQRPAKEDLLEVAMHAMFNFSEARTGPESSRDVATIRQSLQIMKATDYNDFVITLSCKIISLFTLSQQTLKILHREGGIQVLLATLARKVDAEKIVEYASLCLSNSILMEGAEALFTQTNLLRDTMHCIEINEGNARTCKYLLGIFAFSLKHCSSITAQEISERLHVFIRASKRHLHDRTITSYLVEVIGQVSLSEHVRIQSAQGDCIDVLLQIVDVFAQDHIIVLGAIRALLSMSKSSECKMKMQNAGAVDSIEKCMLIHPAGKLRGVGRKLLRRLLKRERPVESSQVNKKYLVAKSKVSTTV